MPFRLRKNHLIMSETTDPGFSSITGSIALFNNAGEWASKDNGSNVSPLGGSTILSFARDITTDSEQTNLRRLMVGPRICLNPVSGVTQMEFQPRLDRRVAEMFYPHNVTPYLVHGNLVSPNTNGTLSYAEITDLGGVAKAETAASVDAVAGWDVASSTYAHVRRNRNFDWYIRIVTGPSSTTSTLYWIALSDAASSAALPTTHNPTSNNMVGFRYMAGTDGGWVGYVTNGSGGSNFSVTSVIYPMVSSTDFLLRLRYDGSEFRFWVNDQGNAVIANTYWPSATTDMNPFFRVVAKTTSARSLHVHSSYMELSI